MEKKVTSLVIFGKVCNDNEDMQVTVSDLNACQDNKWEIDPVDEVTMSDITRGVNAFIAEPRLSTHGRVFPKREPDEDLCVGLGPGPVRRPFTNDETLEGGSARNHSHSIGLRKDSGVQISGNIPKSVERSSLLDLNSGTEVEELGRGMCRPASTYNKSYYFCPIKECHMKFTSQKQIDKHVSSQHKGEGFQCSKCTRRFYRLHHLNQHENVHTGTKPYSCKVCGMKFHTQIDRLEHHKIKHVEPKSRCQCKICGVVGNRFFISKHTRTVHSNHRYKCTECTEDFGRNTKLKDHIRIMHRGQDPYTCDLCGKTFVQKYSLSAHVRYHSTELKCPKCGKVFKTKVYLDGHLLQHEGVKKFCCKVCGKTFQHAHYMYTHMKSHGERCYECAICGGKFSRRDNLKSHIIRHQTTGRTNLKKR